MTRSTRTSLLVLAAAMAPAVASAQHENHAAAGTPTVQQDSTRRVTQTSAGTVSRRPTRRAASRAGEPRAHPRDYVRADSNVCDDLCQRERRMDRLYGKDRERMPNARRTP